MNNIKITEQPSKYRHLEKMTVEELTAHINHEDQTVALAIEKALPALNKLITTIAGKLKAGGRLFYLGAGSGGRLSVLDAIELPTTFGVSPELVQPILAGGVERLIEAPEEMEDDRDGGWKMLLERKVSDKDLVLGITASGSTPFVVEGLRQCRAHGITTGCLTNNPGTEVAAQADLPVEVITGPEFLSGSTRMKSGTAQKMIFDMISTTVMIQLGRVLDNRMVHVKLINDKITDRAVKILMEQSGLDNYDEAKVLLLRHGSVKAALDHIETTGK
ncbi:MAG: N-acetylmuramic acid 6-phosphate etherase [Puia sp.]|nr:N-acetylmuramic acid 6-phosphate etherase [Puia sp.]